MSSVALSLCCLLSVVWCLVSVCLRAVCCAPGIVPAASSGQLHNSEDFFFALNAFYQQKIRLSLSAGAQVGIKGISELPYTCVPHMHRT